MVGNHQVRSGEFDQGVPDTEVGGQPPVVGETKGGEDVGKARRRRQAAVAPPPCRPQGRLKHGEPLAARQLPRPGHVAEREDGAVTQSAKAAGDGEER